MNHSTLGTNDNNEPYPWWKTGLEIIGAAFLIFLATQCTLRAAHAQAVLSGVASITDGDTFRLNDTPVRLTGIDAPERGAMCGGVDMGQRAAEAIASFLAQNTVVCAIDGQDRYGRDLARCNMNGEDVSTHMVAAGWARDWPRYSHGAYAAAEAQARAAHAGVWAQDCPGLWGNRS